MNVIWVVSDTLRRDHIGAYGNNDIHTPSLDAFADEENVYVADLYSLMIFHTSFGTDVEEEVDDEIVSTDLVLYQNYPNPFNLETRIQYHLSNPSRVELTIYNLIGQKVKVLVDEFQTPGTKSVTWDGLNAAGQTLASGIYFYKLNAGDFIEIKKMILIK